MDFSELRSLARAYVPQAKASAINNTNRDLILNEGALDVALRTGCLATDKKINIVGSQAEYNLSSQLDRYLFMDKPGVWFYDGSGWVRIRPKTLAWLDKRLPTWRDSDEGDPLYRAIHGNNLLLHPTPEANESNGLWIYYCQRPTIMVQAGHYPFHVEGDQTEERTDLATLSEAILLYWEMKALKVLGKKQESLQKKGEYLTSIIEKTAFLKRDRNIAIDKKTRFMGKKVG